MTQVGKSGEFTEGEVANALANEADKLATEDQNVAKATEELNAAEKK